MVGHQLSIKREYDLTKEEWINAINKNIEWTDSLVLVGLLLGYVWMLHFLMGQSESGS